MGKGCVSSDQSQLVLPIEDAEDGLIQPLLRELAVFGSAEDGGKLHLPLAGAQQIVARKDSLHGGLARVPILADGVHLQIVGDHHPVKLHLRPQKEADRRNPEW